MRIMAIDYGDARIGLAFSDLTLTMCGDAFTLSERSADRAAEKIAAEATAREVSKIVLGLPKNMDGSEGERAMLSKVFAEKLREKTRLQVILWDERLSSVSAHGILHANGRKMKSHRKDVDAVAASLILEGYLDSLK